MMAEETTHHTSSCSKSQVTIVGAADRPRESLFPMVSVEEALECIFQATQPLDKEYVNFPDCFSYISAEDIIASEPYPPFPASVKDGYAVLAEDESEVRKVIGVVMPGSRPDFDIVPGTCVRLSTGSVVPEKANAVIQVEDTEVAEKDTKGSELQIKILKQAECLQDIRLVGSDVKKGEILITAISRISAAEIGVMACFGIPKALVFRKPCVALLSTGDEILEPGTPLNRGCIRDSNKSSLMYMLIENRIPAIDIGIARDSPDDVKTQLMLGFEKADVIITTGGVSMGEKDILKQVLEIDFNATIHFGRVKMKPGKPTTFSTAIYKGKKKLIFSLPGNPVSAFVCFYLFVIPCIKKLMGYKEPRHSTIKVKLGHEIKLDARPEFYRAYLNCNHEGFFVATGTGAQQSSRLLSMQKADALLVLPPSTQSQSIMEQDALVDAIMMKSI